MSAHTCTWTEDEEAAVSAPKPSAARTVLAWHFLHPDNKPRDGRDAALAKWKAQK